MEQNENRGKRSRQARRRRQRTKALVFLALVLVLIVMVAILLWKGFSQNSQMEKRGSETEYWAVEVTESETETQTEIQTETQTEAPITLNISAEELTSHYAILMRESTGQILLEKSSTERMYPASMTKIMTALVVLENSSDLGTKITISQEMYDALYLAGASMAGFTSGEEVSVRDLLYGVLLPSGAECCTALAEYVAESEEAFAEKMNQKAEELGMTGTHFVNASGLHDENHYSTAEDIEKLLSYALQNDTFREMVSSAVYTSEATTVHPEGLTVYSTLFGYMTEEIRSSGLILGGKTGYTTEAGLCLASYTEIGGERYILITAGAEGSHETEPFHIQDAYHVYTVLQTAVMGESIPDAGAEAVAE